MLNARVFLNHWIFPFFHSFLYIIFYYFSSFLLFLTFLIRLLFSVYFSSLFISFYVLTSFPFLSSLSFSSSFFSPEFPFFSPSSSDFTLCLRLCYSSLPPFSYLWFHLSFFLSLQPPFISFINSFFILLLSHYVLLLFLHPPRLLFLRLNHYFCSLFGHYPRRRLFPGFPRFNLASFFLPLLLFIYFPLLWYFLKRFKVLIIHLISFFLSFYREFSFVNLFLIIAFFLYH